jgi:hypothetical protein
LNDGLGGRPSNSGAGSLNFGLWRSLSSLAARGGGGGGVKEATTAGGGGGGGVIDAAAGGGGGGTKGKDGASGTTGCGIESSSGDFTLFGASEGF